MSRPPYFTALALWPKGDWWNGGGVFADDRTLQFNHEIGRAHRTHLPTQLRVVTGERIPWFAAWGEDGPVSGAILARLGWQMVQEGRCDDRREQLRAQLPPPRDWHGLQLLYTRPSILRRPQPTGGFAVRQTTFGLDYSQYGNHYLMDWELEDAVRSHLLRIEGAECADWDVRGRLLFTRRGQVWASAPETFPDGAHLVADLDDQRLERLVAPAWARR